MPDPASFAGPRLRASVRSLLGAAALLLVASIAFAQAGDADTDATLDTLRKQVDTTQQAVKEPDKLSDADLQRLRAGVVAAQVKSSDIADSLAPQLAGVDARVAELGTPAPGAKEDADVANQRAQLAKLHGQLDAQIKLAHLIAVESEQLTTQIGVLRRSQFQARLGERTNSILSATFWSELRADWPQDRQRLTVLAGDLGTAARAAPVSLWLGLGVAVAVLWGAPRLVRGRAMHWLSTRVPAGRLRRSLHAAGTVLRSTLVAGLTASALHAAIAAGNTLPAATATFLAHFTSVCWFAGFVHGLASALINARRPSWRLLPIPDAVATAVRYYPLALASVSLFSWLAERLAVLVNASLSMAVAVNCVVALVVGLTVATTLGRGERVWRRELAGGEAGSRKTRPVWMSVVAGLNRLVLAVAIVSLLAGFVAFGSFAVKQVVWVATVVGTAYLLAVLIDDASMAWLGNRQHAGAADDGAPAAGAEAQVETVSGTSYAQFAVLVSGVLRLMVALVALVLLLAPFGEGPDDLLRRSNQWREGISIGQVSLQPGAVLQAVLVLGGGLLAVRWLRLWLENRYLPTTSLDPGMRSSALSLFGYVGVVVASALAMSALGIGLERIAWVASALSVGIGFGLQAVVQNFVSGLILLAERPVKVGDWVSLGGVEGDIRRINVRATEIQMGDRSTVIVPNSEFITKVVRNVTLADPLGLVQVKLPVPLGTDPEKVRTLLLEAFESNVDVLDAPAPGVSLDGIEGGQLLFSATGFVHSPRLAGGVKSALLFDVLARVKAAGIALSAPPTMLIGNPLPGAAPLCALPGVAPA